MQHILAVSEFGFPLTGTDIRMVVHTYLQKTGRVMEKFANNIPGEDWCRGFLKQHPNVSMRTAPNIKSDCARITEEDINNYIANLEEKTENVPPSNIFDYDKTNLTDNAGAHRVAVKRGCKYPELIMNTYNSGQSLMICRNACGEILPPYVVHKATKMWDPWKMNGPKGTKYNYSKSGWFDFTTFHS